MLGFSDFKCRFISNSEIHQIADNFYKEHWGKDDLPVDIELIVEKIGLEIIPKDINELERETIMVRSV